MIDWWSIVTTLIGTSIVGIGGVIWRKVNLVLSHVEQFARHIEECEQRNEHHKTVHDMQQHDTDRRLTMLENRGRGR